MPLTAGARLGPYSIREPLGHGGMGEVYRAVDTRLDRTVAIKVLPSHITGDTGKRQRFEREARAVAALNHPHICALFDVGSQDPSTGSGPAVDFLVMEHLDGETLDRRLLRGPLPLEEVFRYAIQIAEALNEAHRRGIVHRDLKPANIMVTSVGVKLLDFGLAKWHSRDVLQLEDAEDGGLPKTETLTVEGTILGTVQYMAPEQVEGKDADTRADLFSFGTIVYEMVTGRKVFSGSSHASLMAAILTAEPPPLTTIEPLSPPELERIVKKCLAKDPDVRWQSARDLIDALKWVAESGSVAQLPSALVATASTDLRRRQPAAGAIRRTSLLVGASSLLLGAGLATAAIWVLMRSSPTQSRPARFSVTVAERSLDLLGPDRNVAISADGTRLVYTSNAERSGLHVRAIDQLEPLRLDGTSGAQWPFLSPDGQWIGYHFRTGASSGELRKIPITGGPAITLCHVGGTLWGASWGPNDTIIFATTERSTGLFSVSATAGEPTVLTHPEPRQGEFDHVMPVVLPGGRAVLFTVLAQRNANEASRIMALDLTTGHQKELIRGGSQAEYVATGHLVYAAAGALRVVRFDAARLEVLSDPVPVVEGVLTKRSGTAVFSVSASGGLIYEAGRVDPLSFNRTLVWVDRQGREEPTNAPPREYVYPRVSPDGTKVAADIRDEENHIWIWNAAARTLGRLTFDPVPDGYPVWTLDGKRILFHSQRSGRQHLHSLQADGIGDMEQLTQDSNPLAATSLTPDGRQLVATQSATKTGSDLVLVRLDATPRVEPLISTSFDEENGEISPDGRWLAYESNELGQSEVYVRPFPHVNGGRWQVSIGGGRQPLWAPGGHELFYIAPRQRALIAVSVEPSAGFRAGKSAKVFETSPYLTSGAGRSYDVSRDGQRFLLVKNAPVPPPSGQSATALTVVLNWSEELKRLAPRP